MNSPTLELTAHELFFTAPGTTAAATLPVMHIDGRVDGKKRVFLVRIECFERDSLRRDVYTVFFRPENDPQAPLLSTRHYTAPLTQKSLDLPPFIKASRAQTWRKNSVKSARPARLWHREGASFGLALYGDGIANVYWPNAPDQTGEVLNFRWRPESDSAAPDGSPGQIELASWLQSEFTAFCQSLYDDADSDLNRVLL